MIDELIDWLLWPRFQLCFWIGVILALSVAAKIESETWGLVWGGVIVLAAMIYGWIWEYRAR